VGETKVPFEGVWPCQGEGGVETHEESETDYDLPKKCREQTQRGSLVTPGKEKNG